MSKSIACVLALAVTSSLALANGGGGGGEGDKKANPYQSGQVSWKPGSGITLAETDEFTLKLMNQLQVQWAFNALDNAPDTNSFAIRRARTTFSGHAFNKDLTFMLRLDAVDDTTATTSGGNVTAIRTNGPVKDAWVQWAVSKSENGTIGVRVGQGKTYHGLEATGTSTGLFFVERSAATRTFSDERSRGAWVHGSHNENAIRWVAGAQNGDVAKGAGGIAEVGEETPNADNELNFVGSVSYDPMGDVTGGKGNEWWRQGDLGDVKDTMGTVGAGIQIGNNRNIANSQDVDSTSINLNTAWALGGGITAQGEVFLRTDNPDTGPTEDSTGWYVQGTYTLPPSGNGEVQWGMGLRINGISTDNTVNFLNGTPGLTGGVGAPGSVTEVSAVVDAFYHGHACKTQMEYTWQDTDPDAGTSSTNHILRIQFQLLF